MTDHYDEQAATIALLSPSPETLISNIAAALRTAAQDAERRGFNEGYHAGYEHVQECIREGEQLERARLRASSTAALIAAMHATDTDGAPLSVAELVGRSFSPLLEEADQHTALVRCERCDGSGSVHNHQWCPDCLGSGYVEAVKEPTP